MPENKEIVTLHFGQAGIQMGNAVWETMITEHGILCNGKKDKDNVLSNSYENAVNICFHHAPSEQFIPRSLIVDTEPSVVDEIRTGYYRDLFHPDLLISGLEDAANNFARGYYSLGKRMMVNLLEKARYIVESCNNFKGFMTYTGSGGGTGSGLYSVFIERLMLEYCGRLCIASLISPGTKLSDSIVEPYNTILRLNQSDEATDLNILIDNESLYRICNEKLQTHKPTYNNINRLLSPVFSSITAPFRFNGSMAGDLVDLSTNLVPYPKVNLPSMSYSPFLSTQNFDHTLLTTEIMTSDVFTHEHSLLNLDIERHKIMSSYLVYRGSHQNSDIAKCLDSLKRQNKFHWVDWCPTGFKVTHSAFPPVQCFPTVLDKSVLMLCNNSGCIGYLDRILHNFQKLHKKRSFIHWYVGEGMEYAEFTHAHRKITQLRDTYEDVCQIEQAALCTSGSEDNEFCDKLPSRSLDSVGDPKTVVEPQEILDHEGIIETVMAEQFKSSLVHKQNDMDSKINKPKKLISFDKETELVKNDSHPEFNMKGSKLEDFVFSSKAKEILMENITTLSPEMKQRMLGFTNID